MKAVVALLVFASVAVAKPVHERLDPSLSKHVKLAEDAWNQGLWEIAATEYGLVLDEPVTADVKQKAVASAMLAWQSSVAAPPSRAERDRLLAASTALYRRVMDMYPTSNLGAYAASLLLDAYNLLEQWDKLVALADELEANEPLLHGHDDLRDAVHKIHRARKRKDAERLESEAKASRDLSAYTRCGDAYLAIYNEDPAAIDNDETLYNAGVCYEEGAAATAAFAAYGLLTKYYPRSRIAMKALARTGKLYGDIAMYDRAAEKLEEYATRYAGERDAYDAMSDAVFYRRGIGDRAKAIADTQYIVKTFGTKKPELAAAAMFSLTMYYENDPDALIKHLRTYISQFGRKAGADRLVIAYAKIGQTLFKQSCKVPGVDGLCVRVNDRAPLTCGTGTTRTLTAVPRDDATLKKAFEAFKSALTENRSVRSDDDNSAGALYWAAQARLAEGDIELEKLIAMTPPVSLDFSPALREKSQKRLHGWLESTQRAGESTTSKYDAVLAMKDIATSITAAERTALVVQTLASMVATAKPAPKANHQVFCEEMAGLAAPLQRRALVGFGVCLQKSVESSWFNDSSRLCERELQRLDPTSYPPLHELLAPATVTAAVISVEPPVR